MFMPLVLVTLKMLGKSCLRTVYTLGMGLLLPALWTAAVECVAGTEAALEVPKAVGHGLAGLFDDWRPWALFVPAAVAAHGLVYSYPLLPFGQTRLADLVAPVERAEVREAVAVLPGRVVVPAVMAAIYAALAAVLYVLFVTL